MWVRGLKLRIYQIFLTSRQSHPMWVRGLKQESKTEKEKARKSHPMWVRGLKHHSSAFALFISSRTLCGCVD